MDSFALMIHRHQYKVSYIYIHSLYIHPKGSRKIATFQELLGYDIQYEGLNVLIYLSLLKKKVFSLFFFFLKSLQFKTEPSSV